MEQFHFIEEFDSVGRRARVIPAYLKHSSGQARIVWKTDEILVGPYGSAISYARYQQILDLFERTGKIREASSGITIEELTSNYLADLEREYTDSKEPRQQRLAMREFLIMYGPLKASEMNQTALKTVREQWISRGLSSTTINMYHSYIVRMFRWGAENELVSPEIWNALKTVQKLRKHRSRAKPPTKVFPIEWESVVAISSHVSRQIWTMIELQWHTGMRPGEVVLMRACDIDRSGPVWFYKPQTHKTHYLGHRRTIGLGPKCQQILEPWLNRKPEAYLFSPIEAEAARRTIQRANRKTKVQPSQEARKVDSPRKAPGERYTEQSYAKGIAAACRKAGVSRWAPNRIRHSFATRVRKEFGLDAAQVALGHQHAKITEVYAEQSEDRIREIAERLS